MKKNILLSILCALSLCAINHVKPMEQNGAREVHEDVFREHLDKLRSKLNEMKYLHKKRDQLRKQKKRILGALANIEIQKGKDASKLCYATNLRHKKAIQKRLEKLLQVRAKRRELLVQFYEKDQELDHLIYQCWLHKYNKIINKLKAEFGDDLGKELVPTLYEFIVELLQDKKFKNPCGSNKFSVRNVRLILEILGETHDSAFNKFESDIVEALKIYCKLI